jgi:hypothetical protein
MWQDPMVQCYDDTEIPSDDYPSVFLNGPTSRRQILEFNHRCLTVKFLREAGFRGRIYVPEPRGREKPGDFTEKAYIHHWESSRRHIATCNAYWVPRDNGELLGLNTNLELGIDIGMVLSGAGRMVVAGWPQDAARMGLPAHYLGRAEIPLFNDQKVMCEYIALALAQQ